MDSVECSVQMFLFFVHNHKNYLLLRVCLIGHNLSRSCQDGVCNVLSVLFNYHCKRKAEDLCHFWRDSFNLTNCIDGVPLLGSGTLYLLVCPDES